MKRWDRDPELEMKSSTIGHKQKNNIHGLVIE